MAPGANGYEGSCGPGFWLQGEPVSSNRRQKRRESLAEAQSSQRKTRGQSSTFDFYLSLLCKRLKSCQLAKTSSSEVVFHLLPSWLSLRALRLCERFSPPPSPGAMPTTRLSSPKSALRGHVFSLEGCVAGRIGRGGGARCRDVRIRQHLTTDTRSEFDASQGAGRTISGYDILPRIQGHAHAKPTSASSVESWAWHPRTDTRAHAARAFGCKTSPVSSNRRRKRRESLAEAQSTQRKTRGQGSTFDFYLSLLCKRLKSCQLAKTSSSEVVFHLLPSWLSLRALRLCERFSPPPSPGAMPTTRLSSPKSALRGHVFSLEACVAGRIGRGGGARCRDVRIRQHLTTATRSEFDASQGAGRTISGYEILPRIQGHAHAKPLCVTRIFTECFARGIVRALRRINFGNSRLAERGVLPERRLPGDVGGHGSMRSEGRLWSVQAGNGFPMESVTLDVEQWSREQFSSCELGDRRRNERLVKFARQVAASPSASTPDQTRRWADCKAAYRLMDCDDIQFGAILDRIASGRGLIRRSRVALC